MSTFKDRKRDKLKELRKIELPKMEKKDINIEEYVNAREQEIRAMEDALKNSVSIIGQRAYQMLPRLLRRRAAGNNPKKMPFGLRGFGKIDEASVKRKKRRFRCKPRLWFKRQNTGKRLKATHIWHAKRFRMVNIWGHRIAWTTNEKSRRRLLRAACKTCVIHDASYYACIQMNKEELRSMVDPNDQRLGSGDIEIVLYEPNGFPFKCLGPVFVDAEFKVYAHPEIASRLPGHSHEDLCMFELRGPQTQDLLSKIELSQQCKVFSVKRSCESTSGVNLIIPQVEAKEYWKKLVFRNHRVAGIDNLHVISTESGQPCYPFDYAGTHGFKSYWERVSVEMNEKYNAKPPAKRPDYKKLGIEDPFDLKLADDAWVVRGHSLLSFFKDNIDFGFEDLTSKFSERFGISRDIVSDLLPKAYFEVELDIHRGAIQEFCRIYTEEKEHCGYVTSSMFSLRRGHAYGIGVVNFSAIKKLKETRYNVVLVKNITSNTFREAKLSLIYLP
jgi:hypothetical protein